MILTGENPILTSNFYLLAIGVPNIETSTNTLAFAILSSSFLGQRPSGLTYQQRSIAGLCVCNLEISCNPYIFPLLRAWAES